MQGSGSVPEVAGVPAASQGTKVRRGIFAPLLRMLEGRVDRDGEAPALEPSPEPDPGEMEGGGSRRDRRLGLPREILDRSLSQKVLDGWLQNRHQVLVPLTFRLERLGPEDVGLLMRFMATAVLNASPADDTARRIAERWLGDIGAKPEAVALYREALDAPVPLSFLIQAIRESDLAPYAYAAAVAAIDTREPVARLFADFIAARLALPADAVRSVDRRYRR